MDGTETVNLGTDDEIKEVRDHMKGLGGVVDSPYEGSKSLVWN